MLRRIITKFNPPSGDGNPDLETIAVNYCLIRLGFIPFAGDELDAAIFACDRMVHPTRDIANGNGGWAIPVVILLHHHLITYSEVTPPLLSLRAVQRARLARARRENVALKYVATSPTDDRTLAAVDSRQAVRNQMAAFLHRKGEYPHDLFYFDQDLAGNNVPAPITLGWTYGPGSTLANRRLFN